MIEIQNLVPGAELKPGTPRITTIAVRELDPDSEGGDRYAVLAIEDGNQYCVWTVNGMNTVNGTYVRIYDEYGRRFAYNAERSFLRALGDWLARL